MCYFEQTRWSCGYWKWGNFRQQCNKEHRTGETCGLKLVFNTQMRAERCKLCEQIEKKQRRLGKLRQDIDRWRREGNRNATIEKTEGDIQDIETQMGRLWGDHQARLMSMT